MKIKKWRFQMTKKQVEQIIHNLSKLGVNAILKSDKITISDELQEFPVTTTRIYRNPDDPFDIDVWQEDCELRSDLQEFSEALDKKYGIYFGCEYAGTFTLYIGDLTNS